MKRIVAILLCTITVFMSTCPAVSFALVSDEPELAAESAVLINASTGEILYDKNKDLQEFPASTTKVLTALLTLENLQLDQTTVISHNASFTEGSRIYLLEGEVVTIEQLLYAMLLQSANDAAIALAEAVAGDVDSFAVMMNERARELGAVNSNFVTPNGLPNDLHVTTAYDLALIAQEAMKNETFRQIVSTYEYTIPATNIQPEARLMHNTNRLIYDTKKADINGVLRPLKYDGILGIKTGYTNAAQSCLVAGAQRDGVEIIGVILHSDPNNQYPDMIKLLDFGFENYTAATIVKAGDVVGTASVKNGSSRNVDVVVAEDIIGTVELSSDGSAASTQDFTYTIDAYELTAPFDAGTMAGVLTLYKGSDEIAAYSVITAEAMELSAFSRLINGEFKFLINWKIMLVIVIAAAVLAYIVMAMKIKRQQEAAKKRRA